MDQSVIQLPIVMEPGCEDLVPVKAHPTDACFDAYAAENVLLTRDKVFVVSLGFRVAIPPGWEMQVRMRSGLALKHGVMLANGIGTIDPDYRGLVGALLYLGCGTSYRVSRGDRIAQLSLQYVHDVQLVHVTELATTLRGQGGFGSTGQGKLITFTSPKLDVGRCKGCNKDYMAVTLPERCSECGEQIVKSATTGVPAVEDEHAKGTGAGNTGDRPTAEGDPR